MSRPYTVPPRLTSIFEERNRIAPGARGAPGVNFTPSSDGTKGDAAHTTGDHVPEDDPGPPVEYIVHACDVSQSMPGTPYWDPRCQQFDIFAEFHQIINEFTAMTPAQRVAKYDWLNYLVWWEASRGYEAIWSTARWREGIRPNGNNMGHKEHGHISIKHTFAAENDTQPIFSNTVAPEEDMTTPAETEAAMRKVLGGVDKVTGKASGPLAEVVKHYIPEIKQQICDELVAEIYDPKKEVGRIPRAIKRYFVAAGLIKE